MNRSQLIKLSCYFILLFTLIMQSGFADSDDEQSIDGYYYADSPVIFSSLSAEIIIYDRYDGNGEPEDTETVFSQSLGSGNNSGNYPVQIDTDQLQGNKYVAVVVSWDSKKDVSGTLPATYLHSIHSESSNDTPYRFIHFPGGPSTSNETTSIISGHMTSDRINALEPGTYTTTITAWGDIITDDNETSQDNVILKEITITLVIPSQEHPTLGGTQLMSCELPQKPKGTSEQGIDPIYLHSGEFYQEEVDLRIKGRGMDFIWARKFRNFMGRKTTQGNKWDFSYNIYLKEIKNGSEPPTEYILFDGNTRADKYFVDGAPPSGVFRQLNKEPSDEFTLHFADKTVWTFHAFDGSPEEGKIKTITDRNTNALQFFYDNFGRLETITDTLGRLIGIEYYGPSEDHVGKIKSITDFGGREVKYDYYKEGDEGGNPGDLKNVKSPEVTLPPGGTNNFSGEDRKTRTYIYYTAAPHKGYLKSITDGKDNVYLLNEYGANADFFRVIKQTWGNPSDVIHIHYTPFLTPLNAGLDLPVMRATVNNRSGNVRQYFYNKLNLVIKTHEYEEKAVAGSVSVPPSAGDADGTNMPADVASPIVTEYEWDGNGLIQWIVHPKGNTEDYFYSSNPGSDPRLEKNLKEVIYNMGSGDEISEKYEYENDFGGGCCFNFVTRITDGGNRKVGIVYNSDGNPTMITRALAETNGDLTGMVTEIAYNAFKQIEHITHPPNPSGHERVDTFVYYTTADAYKNGYLKSVTVDDGFENLVTQFDVDQYGNVTKITDPRGGVTGLLHNELDQVYTLEKRPVTINANPVTYRVDYFYDANNNVTKIEVDNIDETGVPYSSNGTITTEFGYDILNYVDTISRGINESGNAVTKFMYDGNRNLTDILLGQANHLTEPQPSNRIKREYDGRDLLSKVTLAPEHADESVTEYEYDGNKNISKVIRGRNDVGNEHVYDYFFDPFDRLEKIIDPMGNERILSYDDSHNVTKMQVFGEWEDAPGNSGNTLLREIIYDYDLANRLTNRSQTHFDADSLDIGDGISNTVYTYTPESPFLVSVTNDRGHDISYTYDTVNRVETVTDAKGNSRTYAYDDNSNIETVTEIDQSDLSSNETFVTQLIYDELDRVTQLIDPINNVYSYQYDSRDNLITFTDALNVKTKNTYDGLNRLIQTIRALGSDDEVTIAQGWDHSSRLTSQTDGNGNMTEYEYDPLNRMDLMRFADGEFYSYTYDVHHNVDTLIDPIGSEVAYDYDKLGRLTDKEVTTFGGGVNQQTTEESYSYDGFSRLISAIDNDSTVTFAYDSLSNVIEETLNISSGGTLVTSAVYDGVGNLTNVTYPGGRNLSYNYDALNRISEIIENVTTVVEYDYIGSRVERKSFLNGTQIDYGYDDLRRINEIIHSNSASTVILAQGFAWDAMSNKTARSIDGVTESFSYDDLYRLESLDYDYDKVGNRDDGDVNYTIGSSGPSFEMNEYISTPSGTFNYNANGNLSNIDSTSIVMAYDYKNQMVSYNDGDITTYKYDALGRRISKSNNSGETRYYSLGSRVIEETTSANNTTATYVYGNYIDEVLSMNRSNNDYFYHADDIYNVMMLTNAAGGMAEDYDYIAFGQPNNLSSVGNPYMFNGREYDAESGFYNYRTRYLDPSIGRFTTRDTIGIWGDPLNLGNGYTYTGNNPWKYVDPWGFNGEECAPCNLNDRKKMFNEGFGLDPNQNRPGENTGLKFINDMRFFIALSYNTGEFAIETGLDFVSYYGESKDIYNAGSTLADPDASLYDKVTNTGGGALAVLGLQDDAFRAGRGASRLYDKTAAQRRILNIPESIPKSEGYKHVYIGLENGKPRVCIYAGISNNPDRRQLEHGFDRFTVVPITDEPLPTNLARAIEQAIIVNNPSPKFQNQRNSISPRQNWYNDAVVWGEEWLVANDLGHLINR